MDPKNTLISFLRFYFPSLSKADQENDDIILKLLKISGLIDKVNNLPAFMHLLIEYQLLNDDRIICIVDYNGIIDFVAEEKLKSNNFEYSFSTPNDYTKEYPNNFKMLRHSSSKRWFYEQLKL